MKYLKIQNNGILNLDNLRDIASSSKRYKYAIKENTISDLFENEIINEEEKVLLEENLLNHVFYNEKDLKTSLGLYVNKDFESIKNYCRNKNIGKYGTGLKQAYCYFLRENISFSIYAGEKLYKLLKTKRLSDNVYTDFVTINTTPTDLNVAFGMEDYNLPMSIAEIWTNAIDEGDEFKEIVDEKDLSGELGKTTFYIELTEEVKQFLDEWDMYFSFNRDDCIYEDGKEDVSGIKIFSKPDGTLFDEMIVYRRGIQVYKYQKPSINHYQIDDIPITGSRIVKDRFNLDLRIYEILAKKAPKEIIERLVKALDGDSSTYEYHLNWDWNGSYFYSESWSEVLGKNNVKIVETEKEDFYGNIEVEETKIYSLPSKLVSRVIDKKDVKHVNGNSLNGSNAGVVIELEHPKLIEYFDYIKTKLKDAMCYNREFSFDYENIKIIKAENSYTDVFAGKDGIVYINKDYLIESKTIDLLSSVLVAMHEIFYKDVDNIAQKVAYSLLTRSYNTYSRLGVDMKYLVADYFHERNDDHFMTIDSTNYYFPNKSKNEMEFIMNYQLDDPKMKLKEVPKSSLPNEVIDELNYFKENQTVVDENGTKRGYSQMFDEESRQMRFFKVINSFTEPVDFYYPIMKYNAGVPLVDYGEVAKEVNENKGKYLFHKNTSVDNLPF